jgi:hypothetical protein
MTQNREAGYCHCDGSRLLGLLEVADIMPPSSQKSIVRTSRCNRTDEGPLVGAHVRAFAWRPC